MLIENAYSVRFADERKSQRPSATTHLTWRMPTLPFGSLSLRSFGQKYSVEQAATSSPKARIVSYSCCPCILSGVSTMIPTRTPRRAALHQGVTHMRDAVDGVADDGDPLAGRVEHLEDRLLRVAVRDGLAAGSRPDQFDRLTPVTQALQMGRRPKRHGHFEARDRRGGREPVVHEPLAQAAVAGVRDGLGDP